jgi:pilus assembly protein CpaE
VTDAQSDNSNNRLRIYVTGSCDGLPEVLEALEDHGELELVGQSEDIQEAAAALAGGHLEAILHATRGPGHPGEQIASIREYSRAPIILLASGDCSGLLDEALEDGVADLVPLPQLTENVVFAIRKACHQGRRAQVADGRRGRVITVFSPKGGVGKTVVSTNLAGTFAKQMGLNTLLLDLDLQFGDAAIMLGISPEKTIYDLVVAPGELDSEKLAGYIATHPSGIDVLPAPMQPEDAELVTEGKLARLLEVARSSYDVIIVDTSPFFHGPMLATLDRTDDLLLLCGLDVPTIKNVRLSLQTLELLSFPSERVSVLLNRSNSNVGIQRAEVERALETKIRADLPSDRAVPLGVNRGKPVALADPGSDFAKAIADLAKGLIGGKATGKKPAAQSKRRMFARSRG